MVAIFGGSFDPPHSGHRKMLEEYRKIHPEELILIVPNRTSPFKDGKEVDIDSSLHMLRLNFQGMENMLISRVELDREGKSYTWDSLREIHKEYPEEPLNLLIGDDQLQAFHLWKDYSKILTMLNRLVVFHRSSEKPVMNPFLKSSWEKIEFLPNEIVPISSEKIREDLHLKYKPSGLSPEVYEYIQRKGLYSA